MGKAVVTGGAGFIGSHLSQELAKRGHQVTIIDDFTTSKESKIEKLTDKPKIDFLKGSITDIALLQEIFKGASFVFHQAAIPSVPRSIDNPQASNEVNITGTLNVLIAARDNCVKKVIYASSSSVYGDTPILPKVEDMTPNPQSPYAVTKLVGEYYCQVFHQAYGLPTVSLRYFNVYGPGQDPDSQYAAVIPLFISWISRGMPPIIYGDGSQTRDFTFIADVVNANILAAESDASGVFNIGGGGNQVSIETLARLIIKLMGKNIEPVYREPRLGDIMHSLADVSRAKSFGYEPKYSLEKGLRETIEGFQHER